MKNNVFIYVDVGGVLLDWSNVFKTAAKKFNLRAEDIRSVFHENNEKITKGIITSRQFWEKCIQKYNIHNAEDYNFVESWVSNYQPIPEMHNLLYKLQSDYRIGLISNIYEGMLPLLKVKKLIPDIKYDQIIFSCDVGMMKPEPGIFMLAQNRANVDPENIYLIDDRQDFLDSAKQIGWKTFLFDNSKREKSANAIELWIRMIPR